MNQKQLANVLIKILGLSLCIHGIPATVMAIIGGLQITTINGYPSGMRSFSMYLTSLAYALIPFAIGIYLILQSRFVTEKLFKDE